MARLAQHHHSGVADALEERVEIAPVAKRERDVADRSFEVAVRFVHRWHRFPPVVVSRDARARQGTVSSGLSGSLAHTTSEPS